MKRNKKIDPIAPYTDENLEAIYTENPEIINAKWLPDTDPNEPEADASELFTDTDRENFTRGVIALFRITAEKSRKRIAAAIEDTAKRDKLTPGELMLLEQIAIAYFYSPEARNEIAELLNIETKLIAEHIRQTLLVMGGDGDQLYLKGLEPPEDERIKKNAAKVIQQKRFIAPPTMLQPTSLLARRITDIKDTGENSFPIVNKERSTNIRVQTNKRITPLDVLVDKAISNFVTVYREKVKTTDNALFPFVATTKQLFCIANGLSFETKVSPEMLNAFDARIDYLTNVRLRIFNQNDPDELPLEFNAIDAIRIKKTSLLRLPTGQRVDGWGFSRPGALHIFDERHKGLNSLRSDVANITQGYWYRGTLGSGKLITTQTRPTGEKGYTQARPTLTTLSMIIREYLIMEIYRIRNAPSLAGNNPSGNKITYNRMIEYESNPALVEFGEEDNEPTIVFCGDVPRRLLKQGENAKEKRSIWKMKARRREIALEILGHFQACGWIVSFEETPDKAGVVIVTEKTDYAIRKINRAEKRRAKAEKKTE